MEFVLYCALSTMLGLGVGLTISFIGKPRAPITPAVALVTTIYSVLQFIALSYLYQH